MSRPVNTSHPRYTLGVLAANRSLDAGGVPAADRLTEWRMAAQRAHDAEDLDAYHYAAGQVDTLAAFVDEP